MNKISFVNPNFQQGPDELNAYYLPYSVGVLWSYASSFPEISCRFQLGEFIWRRDNLSVALEKLRDSHIVAFSTYIWNKSYNYALAKLIKEVNPDCLILFGGPEPPVENPKFFEMFPYIDIMVKHEGEATFKEILDQYESGVYDEVAGILLNKNGTMIETADRERIDNIDLIPSPYTTGVFDKLMADNPTVEWNGVLESNRGCPYQCTFCDWGSLTYNKVKKFNLERVLDELEWIGKNKIGFISIADANFGIFADRDNIIADKLIDIQKRYSFPNAYTISWAKNQRKEVIEIVKRLVDNGARMGLTVSVQSLDENVLDIVKRKNMDLNQIEDIFERCDRENIPVITELILGLPGETLASWKENYYKLFRANNHTGITTYNAQILENAEMNLGQRAFYKIESVVVRDYLSGSNNEGDMEEGVAIVKSTRDMPAEHLIDAVMFTWFMNTFHINGLSNLLSRFANRHQGTDYREFYDGLYQYILADDWFRREIEETTRYYRSWFGDGSINHPKIGKLAVTGMNLSQRTSIAVHIEDQYENVFGILERYYRETFPEQEKYIDDLFEVQKNYYIRHSQIHTYPKTIVTKHNILGYVQSGEPLETPTGHFFEFYEDKNMSLTRFCENLWFGRRRNFGKAYITHEQVK